MHVWNLWGLVPPKRLKTTGLEEPSSLQSHNLLNYNTFLLHGNHRSFLPYQEDDTSASGPHSTPFYSASAESSYYEQGSTPHSSFGSPSNPPDTPCSTPGTTLSSNHYQSTPTSSFGSSPCHQTTPTPLSSSPCHHATPSSNCPLLASQATPQSPTKTRKSIMNDERWNTTPTKSKRTRKNCDQLTPQRKSARTKNKKDDGDNEDKYENSQEFYGIMIPTKL